MLKIFFVSILLLPVSSFSKGLKDLEWLSGEWKCSMKNTETFKGKSTENKSSGQFEVKITLGGTWLEGKFYKKEEVTRSFYGFNKKTNEHVMYFMDKFGGYGKGIIKEQKGNRFKYTGNSEFGNYNSKFTKEFIKVSKKRYDVKYETINTKNNYISKTNGTCLRL